MKIFKIFFIALLLTFSNCYATTYTVTNTSDLLITGSLRKAITDANADVNVPHIINFNITGGTAPYTISPATALPAITKQVTINGFSQNVPGNYDYNIILNGSSAPGAIGLTISGSANGSMIQGLVIKSWSDGIKITNASNCQIDQNVIHSNSANGIYILNASYTFITANRIGTDNGTVDLGNALNGIKVEGSESVGIENGNLISGNNADGIYCYNSPDIVIDGNKIGTNITGTAGLGNSQNGIELNYNCYGYQISDNLISGNSIGIKMASFSGTYSGTLLGNIFGNKIGTDATGTSVIGNGIGIQANGSGESQIEGNIIAASSGTSGVSILSQNKIYGFAKGINLNISSGTPGNNSYAPPTIVSNSIQAQTVNLVGTSHANDRIEIFRSDGSTQNAIEYLGPAFADGSGNWTFSLTASTNSNYFIATASAKFFVGDGYGFSNTSEFSNMLPVTVPCPTITITGLPSAMVAGSAPVTLTGSPSGGTFSGPGISGNTFDPTVAGSGTHTITYTNNNLGTCPSTATATVTVTCPAITISGLPSAMVVGSASVTLTGSPSGGTFSGSPGISGNTFDPTVAGSGTHTITYTNNNLGTCPSTATATVTVCPVVTISGLPSLMEEGSSSVILTGNPSGGIFSGTGISGNTFNPNTAGSGTYTITYTISGTCTATATVTVPGCENCIGSFSPAPGKKYVITAWVKENITPVPLYYSNSNITLYFTGANQIVGPFAPVQTSNIIDGWQRIEGVFDVPAGATEIKVNLNNSGSADVFFDDIRIHPFDANMKSFVYDPITQRLVAELDENNYATLYEYDEEGALIRVKKETERGIMTIKETRNNIQK